MTAHATTRIANDREYQVTLDTMRNIERGIAEQERFRTRRDPAEHWLVVNGLEGMLADLCQQIAEYRPGNTQVAEVTQSAIRRFEAYLGHLEAAREQLDPALLALLHENTQRFLDDLRAQAIEYETAQRRNG
jgi:hypothetical protein